MPNLTLTYNAYNQVVQAAHTLNGTEQYAYDPSGQRVWKQRPDGTQECPSTPPGGTRLSSYTVNLSTSALRFTNAVHNLYFAGRLIWTSETNVNSVISDRLDTSVLTNGSNRKAHFPYGEQRQGTAYQFATYRRDVTGLDYAVNRYYSSQIMRFTSPDPSGDANPGAPQSWNQYAYVQGDPVNANDPMGLRLMPAILREGGTGYGEGGYGGGFSVFGGSGSSNLPGGGADASWGYGSYMSATGGITDPNMLATVTSMTNAARPPKTAAQTTPTATQKQSSGNVVTATITYHDGNGVQETTSTTRLDTSTVADVALPMPSLPFPTNSAPVSAPRSSPAATPPVSRACPAGQQRMSNGQCDKPLPAAASQIVKQTGHNVSRDSLCTTFNAAMNFPAIPLGVINWPSEPGTWRNNLAPFARTAAYGYTAQRIVLWVSCRGW